LIGGCQNESEQDLADLVEYLFGDANTTWGSLRAADGHASIYNMDKYFEIGNEIDTPGWAQRALAMEQAATKLGMGRKLRYAATGCDARPGAPLVGNGPRSTRVH